MPSKYKEVLYYPLNGHFIPVFLSNDLTDLEIDNRGRRYGLDPQHAQSNGTFYIDYHRGYIHFGSSLSGETIIVEGSDFYVNPNIFGMPMPLLPPYLYE